METLYLELSLIEQLSASTVEHVINRVTEFVHDKKDAVHLACEELKLCSWFDCSKLYAVKKAAIAAMIEADVEASVVWRLVE